MFLKTLSLKGFKSFADATRLDLEPGVTVVVGPNGSGKSNVVDAMAWVLGAQRPTAVRSQKMDDVIFAGTSKKKALGRAEVSITLDNSTKVMPIEFDEVTITRRLFRTGDSEYEINGVPCRLLDIQELLSDSGVGRHQHVIISQGQIDRRAPPRRGLRHGLFPPDVRPAARPRILATVGDIEPSALPENISNPFPDAYANDAPTDNNGGDDGGIDLTP